MNCKSCRQELTDKNCILLEKRGAERPMYDLCKKCVDKQMMDRRKEMPWEYTEDQLEVLYNSWV